MSPYNSYSSSSFVSDSDQFPKVSLDLNVKALDSPNAILVLIEAPKAGVLVAPKARVLVDRVVQRLDRSAQGLEANKD
ncbi:hypothetical protein QYF36_000578 [Acer negundo]|nr:hypothetical protein QYF36_000578 [Acer negundo]